MIRFHFLNIGSGATVIVEFPLGRVAMVDVHRTGDYGLTDPVGYYIEHIRQQGFPKRIWRFIATHPHEDHLLGLADVRSDIGFDVFWYNDNPYTPLRKGPEWERYKPDWQLYKRLTEGGDIDGIRCIKPKRAELNRFWEEDGITILSPDEEMEAANDPNDSSYVLKVSYAGNSVILPGDALEPAWNSILSSHSADELAATILLAPHHGMMSGYVPDALEAIEPSAVIVSQGDDVDAKDDATDDYRAFRTVSEVWRTGDAGVGDVRLYWDADGQIYCELGGGPYI